MVNKSTKEIYKTGTLWINSTVSIFGFVDFQSSNIDPEILVLGFHNNCKKTKLKNKKGIYRNFYHVNDPQTKYELRVPKNNVVMLLENEAVFYYNNEIMKGEWVIVLGEKGISGIEKSTFNKFFIPI